MIIVNYIDYLSIIIIDCVLLLAQYILITSKITNTDTQSVYYSQYKKLVALLCNSTDSHYQVGLVYKWI